MVWKLFLWSSLRKSYSICLENSDLAKLWPFKTDIWLFFGKNWLFWEFLTYSFQTQLWIFLIFGMELLWILTLSGEPIILCLVSLYLQNRASDFDDFCTDIRDSCPEWFGLSAVCYKILACPPGGIYPPKSTLLAKMVLLSLLVSRH